MVNGLFGVYGPSVRLHVDTMQLPSGQEPVIAHHHFMVGKLVLALRKKPMSVTQQLLFA